MKTFSEYHKEQEIKEFSQWLESQGYDPQTLDLESLLEAGAWEKAKKWGRNAAIAGALLGVGAGIGGKFTGQQDAPSLKQQQTQSQSDVKLTALQKRIQQKRDRVQGLKDQLTAAGKTSGTFKHGKLQDDKRLQDDVTVSSSASKFFVPK